MGLLNLTDCLNGAFKISRVNAFNVNSFDLQAFVLIDTQIRENSTL